MDKRKHDVVILGGGISGIAAAIRAAEAGLNCIVIEKTNQTGGLWGSVERKGFIFDLGVHGLYPASKEHEYIVEYIRSLVQDRFVPSEKKTKIYFRDKLLNYPLVASEFLTSYGLEGIIWAITLFWARVWGLITGVKWIRSFKDFTVCNFGSLLYRIYFEPYVKKVWGVDPKYLDKEAIARRVQRIRITTTVKEVLKKWFRFLIFKKEAYEGMQPFNFHYPSHGAQTIADALRKEAEQKGAQFMQEAWPTRIESVNGKYEITLETVAHGPVNLEAQNLVSSIPLPDFLKLLYPEPDEELGRIIASLKYRALRMLNILIDREKIFDAQWVYFQGENFTFSRLNEFKNLSPHFCPEGKTSLAVEYNCDVGDRIWSMSNEELLESAIRELDQMDGKGGYIKHQIIDSFSVHLAYGYPVMTIDNIENVGKAKKYIDRFNNVHSIGRQGNFCYVNGDECVAMAFEAIDKIIENKNTEVV